MSIFCSCSDVGVMPSFEIEELSPRMPKVPNVSHQGHSFKEEVLEKIRNATEVTQIVSQQIRPHSHLQVNQFKPNQAMLWNGAFWLHNPMH